MLATSWTCFSRWTKDWASALFLSFFGYNFAYPANSRLLRILGYGKLELGVSEQESCCKNTVELEKNLVTHTPFIADFYCYSSNALNRNSSSSFSSQKVFHPSWLRNKRFRSGKQVSKLLYVNLALPWLSLLDMYSLYLYHAPTPAGWTRTNNPHLANG